VIITIYGHITLDPVLEKVPHLLDSMLAEGLSSELLHALTRMVHSSPGICVKIQGPILQKVSQALCGKPFFSGPGLGQAHPPPPPPYTVQASKSRETETALETLSSLPWIELGSNLAGLARFASVVLLWYLEEGPPWVNRVKVGAACLHIAGEAQKRATRSQQGAAGGEGPLEDSVLYGIVKAAVSHPWRETRLDLLGLLDARFDDSLCKPRILHLLCLGLHDEECRVRAALVTILGRFVKRNGVLASPPLLQCLVQVTAEIEYADQPQTQMAALTVLESLVLAAPSLLQPHVATLLRTLLLHAGGDASKLLGPGSVKVLQVVELLSRVSPGQVESQIDPFIRIILAHLDPTTRLTHRERASVLQSLAGTCSHIGYTIRPYHAHPQLLPTLLGSVAQTEDAETRLAASRAIGVLGALDPDAAKPILAAHGSLGGGVKKTAGKGGGSAMVGGGGGESHHHYHGVAPPGSLPKSLPKAGQLTFDALDLNQDGFIDEAEFSSATAALAMATSVSPMSPNAATANKGGGGVTRSKHESPSFLDIIMAEEDEEEPFALPSDEEHLFPTVAIACVKKIVQDPLLAAECHEAIVAALCSPFTSGIAGNEVYLVKVMPTLLRMMASPENPATARQERERLFVNLAGIVENVKTGIKQWVPALLDLVERLWPDVFLRTFILPLIQALAEALGGAFKEFLPSILPPMLATLRDFNNDPNTQKILNLLEAFQSSLNDYLYLVIPALVQLFSKPPLPQDGTVEQTRVRVQGLECLVALVSSGHLDCEQHLSSLVIPVIRLFDSEPSRAVHAAALRGLGAISAALGEEDFAVFRPMIEKELLLHGVSPPDSPQQGASPLLGGGNSPPESPGMSGASSPGRLSLVSGLLSPSLGPAPGVDSVASPPSTSSPGGASQPTQGGATPTSTRSLHLTRTMSGVKLSKGSSSGLRGRAGMQGLLRSAWSTTSNRVKEDWTLWLQHLAVELLRNSPSLVLRACAPIVQSHAPAISDLFPAAFLSCWRDLDHPTREDALHHICIAIRMSGASGEGSSGGEQANAIPPQVRQQLIALAEFMERAEVSLSLDISELSSAAEKCHAYAAAIHYKESEFILRNTRYASDLASALCTRSMLHLSTVHGQVNEHHHHLVRLTALRGVSNEEYARSELVPKIDRMTEEERDAFVEALPSEQASAVKSVTELAQTAEDLIRLNHASQMPDAAVGLMRYCQGSLGLELPAALEIELKNAIFHQMRDWELRNIRKSLHGYTVRLKEGGLRDSLEGGFDSVQPGLEGVDAVVGCIRCHYALSDWEEVLALAQRAWDTCSEASRAQFAKVAAMAAMNLGEWDAMSTFAEATPQEGTGAFLRAVLEVRGGHYEEASRWILQSRESMDSKLVALVSEGYPRAYKMVVRLQRLTELEETIAYRTQPERRETLKRMWVERLHGVTPSLEVWQRMLSLRSLALPIEEDLIARLMLVRLAMRTERHDLARKELEALEAASDLLKSDPQVMFAKAKLVWAEQDSEGAIAAISELVQNLDGRTRGMSLSKEHGSYNTGTLELCLEGGYSRGEQELLLMARCLQKKARWLVSKKNDVANDTVTKRALDCYQKAAELCPGLYTVWHGWAHLHYQIVQHLHTKAQNNDAAAAANSSLSRTLTADKVSEHARAAVEGFFRAIGIGGDSAKNGSLQDILRVLTLWFDHGHDPGVAAALTEGLNRVPIDVWLSVIPQIIARVGCSRETIRNQIHDLLFRLGCQHPQAIIYSIMVAAVKDDESSSEEGGRQEDAGPRAVQASRLLEELRAHSPSLVMQAQLVSSELIRSSILWPEMWHEALDEAAAAYFVQNDAEQMLTILEPLHLLMERGPETPSETHFVQSYGRVLGKAREWVLSYRDTGCSVELNQSWLYYKEVFDRIKNEYLPHVNKHDLGLVSPKLLQASHFELALPGSYRPHHPVPSIVSFGRKISVFSSKQRPRRITIQGSDGKEYPFLLKGHEDLRQDERVMQLLQLVNSLLSSAHLQGKQGLQIARYAVIPLSKETGLLGWVPHSDTLQDLVMNYREERSVIPRTEVLLAQEHSPTYDSLPRIMKVEAFKHTLSQTTGLDLYKAMWLGSPNSEVWLDRRMTFTQTLAANSMVGYILGLGDRHPCNLMIDRVAGTVVHIDYGDCFEVAQERESFPEKVPFRLTRMLVNACEASGIEGNFRTTCVEVLAVIRANAPSVEAMLQAFLHDPLINWRLLDAADAQPVLPPAEEAQKEERLRSFTVAPLNREQLEQQFVLNAAEKLTSVRVHHAPPSNTPPETNKPQLIHEAGSVVGAINVRAQAVKARIDLKLSGKDLPKRLPPVSTKRKTRILNPDWRVKRTVGGFGEKEVKATAVAESSAGGQDVAAQVDRIIEQATSHENLSQHFTGWCPFW